MAFCHIPDELLQPTTETDVSHGRQQPHRSDPLQASSGERLVVAPPALPGAGLAAVRLPGRGRLRRLHPSAASAVEPPDLCRILTRGAQARPVAVKSGVQNMSVVCIPADNKGSVVCVLSCVCCGSAAQAGLLLGPRRSCWWFSHRLNAVLVTALLYLT